MDTIPKFYFKKKATTPVDKAVQLEVRKTLVQRKQNELPTTQELDALYKVLIRHSKTVFENEAEVPRISIYDFMKAKEQAQLEICPLKFQTYFKAGIFLRFPANAEGDISTLQFYNYILRKVSLLQARIDLSFYDEDGDGFFTEDDLTRFVTDLVPSLKLENISEQFKKFYICTAVRKFQFFLDPLKRGKIMINNIILSPILTELYELREDGPAEQTNWFSSHSALRIYGQFLNLDTDHNGMLSREELGRYDQGNLSTMVLDRVFQECQTFGGEMDFRSFLDFVLANENINTPEAMTYFFRLFDTKHTGYLDSFTIRSFLNGILYNGCGLDVDHIVTEVIDMANKAETGQIYLKDLHNCGIGGNICYILSNSKGILENDVN